MRAPAALFHHFPRGQWGACLRRAGRRISKEKCCLEHRPSAVRRGAHRARHAVVGAAYKKTGDYDCEGVLSEKQTFWGGNREVHCSFDLCIAATFFHCYSNAVLFCRSCELGIVDDDDCG